MGERGGNHKPGERVKVFNQQAEGQRTPKTIFGLYQLTIS